jgi:subtilisin-like proprotein convertase family protein
MSRSIGRSARNAMLGCLLLVSILMPASSATADTFSNDTPITIPSSIGACGTPLTAVPYPSTISVSGLAQLADVNVTLTLEHTAPDDVGVLLVGPQGDEVLLMADAGGASAGFGASLTFDDSAPGPLPDAGPLDSGTFRPTRGTADVGCAAPSSFPSTAPAGPYPTSFADFDLSNPNGTWRLFVIDDTPAVGGEISGWSLELTEAEPYLKVALVVSAGSGTVTGQGISCPPDCAEHAAQGTLFSLHATPAAGSVFSGWSGGCIGTSPDCSVVLNETTFVGARFDPGASPSPSPPPEASADLSVSGPTTVPTAQVGSPISMSYDVGNAGPDTAAAATLDVRFPAEVVVSSKPATCNASAGGLTCSLGDLASGAHAQVSLGLTPSRGDPFTVVASVDSTTADPDTSDDSTSVSVDPLATCTIEGTDEADVLEGTDGIDVICGWKGPDVLSGLDGNDILRGGHGADELRGSLGDDLVLGGPGYDELFGGQGDDTCDRESIDVRNGCEHLI